MRVAELHVRNFRNHHDSHLEFGRSINLLLGSNGQGKTNILEAVSYLGLSKSFFSVNDSTVLQVGEDSFEVEGNIVEEAGAGRTIRICFDDSTGQKEISINRIPLERLSLLVGRFPVVVLSPESSRITNGPPGERRKFLDLALSQQSRSYLEDLLEYRRVLRHRNRLLWSGRVNGSLDEGHFRSWTESLATLGSRIVLRRRDFIASVQGGVSSTYHTIAENRETVSVCYETAPEVNAGNGAGDISQLLMEELARRRGDELRRGVTLVGPHRDDLSLFINGMDVQQYASQGQHKTLLLALKIAEFAHLRETIGEVPVLLLDDLFGELDSHRAERIIRLVEGLGQSIITATGESVFQELREMRGDIRRYAVENGTCRVC